jgi:hypothetical protein
VCHHSDYCVDRFTTHLEQEQLTLWVGSTKSQVGGLLAGSSSSVGVDIWLLLKRLKMWLMCKHKLLLIPLGRGVLKRLKYILYNSDILLISWFRASKVGGNLFALCTRNRVQSMPFEV